MPFVWGFFLSCVRLLIAMHTQYIKLISTFPFALRSSNQNCDMKMNGTHVYRWAMTANSQLNRLMKSVFVAAFKTNKSNINFVASPPLNNMKMKYSRHSAFVHIHPLCFVVLCAMEWKFSKQPTPKHSVQFPLIIK